MLHSLVGKPTGAGKSARRENSRHPFSQSVLMFPIRGGKSTPAEMADATEVSRKEVSLVTTQTPLRVRDTFALRLITEIGEPLLLRCVVRRVSPIDSLRSTVGADFVTLLKDGRLRIA